MNTALQVLLSEIEHFGLANDAAHDERGRRMLNITRGTGEFLAHVIASLGARDILEVGTSNGYSTLWLADAVAPDGGKVTTIEMAPDKVAMARQNFAAAGLEGVITQREGEAGQVLAQAPDGAYDLVFLDSERAAYPGWWLELKRILRPHGLLIVDNATSHAAEMAPFVQVVNADGGFTTSLVHVGKGELVAGRDADLARHWAGWRAS